MRCAKSDMYMQSYNMTSGFVRRTARSVESAVARGINTGVGRFVEKHPKTAMSVHNVLAFITEPIERLFKAFD